MQSLVGHAFGTLVDLPVDISLLILVAAGAFLGTGGLLTRRDAISQSPPEPSDWPASSWLGRTAENPASRAVGSALGIGVLITVLALAVSAPAQADRNAVPRLVLVLLWGGLVPASLLFGRFYQRLNPLRPLADALRRGAAIEPRELTPSLGRWPATVLAAILTVASQTALESPAAVSVAVLVYVAAQVGLGARYGSAWYAAADPFQVLNDVVGTISVGGRDTRGKVGLRNPVVSASRAPTPPGTIAFVSVLVGGSWLESIADVAPIENVAALAAASALGCVVAWGVLRLGAVRAFLIPALLPLAGAYGLQLFVVPLLLEGQIGLSQLSDPFGRSEALPARVAAGAEVVPQTWLALGLYVSFVTLHLVALAIAHRVSLLRFDLRGARAVQFPMRAVLLASLVLGLWLPTLGG